MIKPIKTKLTDTSSIINEELIMAMSFTKDLKYHFQRPNAPANTSVIALVFMWIMQWLTLSWVSLCFGTDQFTHVI